METLRAKFGIFWGPFDVYLQTSGVPLSDVDSDTDWDQLLAEVAWPEGCLPNVVQRSALKKALKAYCRLRDASVGYVPPTPSIPVPTLAADGSDHRQAGYSAVATPMPLALMAQEGRHRSMGPIVGNYARNFSKAGAGSDEYPRKITSATTGPKAHSRSGSAGNQGTGPSAGLPEEANMQMLAECFLNEGPLGVKAPSDTRSLSAPRVAFTDDASSIPEPAKHRMTQVADCSERELNEMLDSFLQSRRASDGPSQHPSHSPSPDPRIFASVPASTEGPNDLLQLADALLECEASAPRRPTRRRSSSSSRLRRKGIPHNAETCPTVLNATEQAISDVTNSEFEAYRKRAGMAPPPARSAPTRFKAALLPNFKGRAQIVPKVNISSLHQRNLELHEQLGIDEGTVMQHWLGKWRQRGRPNRGADLLQLEETTLQHLTEHRHGRPVEDSWALHNMLRAYGNARSELLRNMMADETAMKMDQDGDDALNTEEFRQLYLQTHPDQTITDDMIRKAWEFADKDHSGEVDFSEMMLWLDKATFDATGIFVPEK